LLVHFWEKIKGRLTLKMSVGVAPLACPNTGRATLSYQPQSERISDSDRVNKFTSLKWDLWRPRSEFEEYRDV
jgi:hypothetical protein